MSSNIIRLKTDGPMDVCKLYTILLDNNIDAKAFKGYRTVNIKSLLGLMSLEPDNGFELEINPNVNVEDVYKKLEDFVDK